MRSISTYGLDQVNRQKFLKFMLRLGLEISHWSLCLFDTSLHLNYYNETVCPKLDLGIFHPPPYHRKEYHCDAADVGLMKWVRLGDDGDNDDFFFEIFDSRKFIKPYFHQGIMLGFFISNLQQSRNFKPA